MNMTALRKKASSLDWRLLVFLLLFLNVKLLVKLLAIVLIYILRPDFKFGFRRKNSRLPLFYPLIIGIGILSAVISGQMLNLKYDLVVLTGVLFWGVCILAIHQLKLSVEQSRPEQVHNTIFVFLLINAVVSLLTYFGIMIETGHINPFSYQGSFQKYFISTGDYIKGVSFDTSTANAILNAFGLVYFLKTNKNIPALLCMAVLLLTGSNITNLLLLGTLIYVLLFNSSRDQKSMIVVCLAMLLIFLVKISPQNNRAIEQAYYQFTNQPGRSTGAAKKERITAIPDSLLDGAGKKRKFAQLSLDSIARTATEKPALEIAAGPLPAMLVKAKPVIPADRIHSPSFQNKNDTNDLRKSLLSFMEKEDVVRPMDSLRKYKMPGKLVAMIETFEYFRHHILQVFTGTGPGNFSSRLAFRATALKIAGGYPERFAYVDPRFLQNHLDVYLFYFSRSADFHSLVNSPNSTWLQLLSEYGIFGLAAFIFGYLGYFAKGLDRKGYGPPLLLMMAGVFFTDYCFELLSFTVLFELLSLLNKKETALQKTNE